MTATDREVYLAYLRRYSEEYGLQIWAYCLMTNHIHLVATPDQENALSFTLKALHSRYTQRQNFLHHWAGHLWQGRFFSTPLDESYFWRAMRYVERNPVRAGLVERAEDYRWSSAAAHCGLVNTTLLEPLPAENIISSEGWSGWLAGEDVADDLLLLRAATASGRPCGSQEFVEELETLLGRYLQAKPRGRPRKSQSLLDAD